LNPRTASHPISSRAQAFIDSVVALQPKLAVFDCDGTLWEGDCGMDFLYWEIEDRLISTEVAALAVPRYAAYKQGQVDEFTMCAEMTTLHEGIPLAAVEEACARFFPEVVAHRIFPEMLDLTQRLAASGCELWAVSSTNEWVIREGVKRFGIPAKNVLAGSAVVKSGAITGELIRLPTGPGKADAIREVIGRAPDCVFGNSVHDADMIAVARNPFAINPNPDLEVIATDRKWTVYKPALPGRM
jgi:phosphoserine phosphatase